jgi:hypothetical protein
MFVRFLPVPALIMAFALPASAQSIMSKGPVLKDQPVAPTKDLKLVRVGGGLEEGAIEYFDETSIVRTDGTASVWRLYVLSSPRTIGRLMTQAVWVLSDFDCQAQTVTGRSSSLLGMGLELMAHGSPHLGETLFPGQLADAIVAMQACDGGTAPGDRLASVSAAIRNARSTKE